MKRLLALLLAMAMLFVAVGCADTETAPTDSDSTSGSSQSSSAGSDDGGQGDASTGDADGSSTNKTDGKTDASSKKTTTAATTKGKTTTVKGKTTTTKKTGTTTTSTKKESIDMSWYQEIVDSENAWLASLQLDNGAMPMTGDQNGKVKATPYFSDFAALSLLNQADKYASNVKAYMNWHFEHLNTAATDYNGVDGTIYDYYISVSNGKVTGETILTDDNGKKSYDSTDSYAATFLCVLQKYVEKTGDKAYVQSHYAEIERIVNALYATMDDGLTYAKPDYKIKYLMDNCEVYEGLVAAEKLYTQTLVPAKSAAKTTLNKLKASVKEVASHLENDMWNKKGYYEAALGEGGGVAYTFSWSNFYPCATAQLFPVMCGVISPDSARAKSLYNTFCENYDWENFKIPDTFYWGSNAYAAAIMGDVERVETYLTYYKKIMSRHSYPLYNADAAKVCMAAYTVIQQYS